MGNGNLEFDLDWKSQGRGGGTLSILLHIFEYVEGLGRLFESPLATNKGTKPQDLEQREMMGLSSHEVENSS